MLYFVCFHVDALMTTQILQDSGVRYPQTTEPGHFQHISQPQGKLNLF